MRSVIKRVVAKTNLSDAVAEELEKMIREGAYLVGDFLPSERDLMEIFEVGRPSIREALNKLAYKGLVAVRSGERTRVTRPSPEAIISGLSGLSKDFLSQPGGMQYFDQLRLFFESSLVRYAAERATEAQLKKLEHALALNEAAIGNVELFKRTDINFHRVLAEIPENPIFLAVNSALVDWVVSDRKFDDEDRDGQGMSFAGHRSVLEMIRRRDANGADAAMKRHLYFASEKYLR